MLGGGDSEEWGGIQDSPGDKEEELHSEPKEVKETEKLSSPSSSFTR